MGKDEPEEVNQKKDDVTHQVINVLGTAFPGRKFVVIIFNEDAQTCDLAINTDVGVRQAAEAMASISNNILTALNKTPTVN